MSDSTYSVIFRGDLQPGYTVADVKANFARLFKIGPESVEKLFCGRPLAIKKALPLAQAEHLQATLAKLGALSSLKSEVEVVAAAAQPAPEPDPASVLKPEAEEAVPAAPQPAADPGLSLAPMQGYLLKEHERKKVEPTQVQVSHLSLAPSGGNLVESSELNRPEPQPVQVPDWKLNTAATFKIAD
ncbi:hypothetical protein [Microbulbifer pacificus]|uniref:Uncharacterized protein n=1 Tax=Microbulbifer pacificus TaxID=407164 RepID=A0AAU0N2M6_9GAMM|nr:hypothetical protein [Microbulbifer pacificus]WOX06510.1 hypothetical protein R5R33_05085 [Microbulbifer pacificus]